MIKSPSFLDISGKEVVVIYKHSRFTYALEHGSKKEVLKLSDKNDPIIKSLIESHENNLKCIDSIRSILDELGVTHHLICRSDLSKAELKHRFVISVGGDGTLLDTSHYCEDSPVLGVNSDPRSSIGALCAATEATFRVMLEEIYQGALLPSSLSRLSISIGQKMVEPIALNDVLFCNKNPASMSRFALSLDKCTESHRSSGIWISTPAGSTGGIYSSGAEALPLDANQAIFRLREPYWCDKITPQLLHGSIFGKKELTITSNMTDAELFIDGPHKTFDICLGESVTIGLSNQPLWLFDGPRLINNRKNIIEQRKSMRNLF